MPLPQGTRIGSYTIIAHLGTGGMGEVYRALDPKLGREVAIKVLPGDFAEDAVRLRRFQQEARALASLSHPNIVQIYDAGEHEGRHHLVMELLEGETLRQRLAKGRMAWPRAVALAAAIADGLAAAHAKGIVHRDLKPENLILTEHGIKLLDFGLAKLRPLSMGTATTLDASGPGTLDGALLGTMGYMSPEQIRGEAVDPRCDVFTLGALLVEMLTGRPAFQGGTAADTLSAILLGEPPELASVERETSPGLMAILRRCLEKRQEDRFASALDLAFSLRALLQPAAPDPGPPGPSIAVLPFENLSPDPDNAFFADGLTEEIIAGLSKVRALRVISRTSAMHYKGTHQPLPEIARELRVGHLLEGSVRRAGDSLRITAQLIDAATDAHLWAETYAGALEDVFDMQEKVARAIVVALEVHLSPPEENRKLAARPLPNPAAYDSYLRAYRDSMLWDAEALKRAERHLDHARGLVGDHPMILAGLALVRFQAVNLGLLGDEGLKEARQLAERALVQDGTLAQAHGALGWVCMLEGDIPGALQHTRRARAEAPGEVSTWGWLPWFCACVGLTRAAEDLLEEVVCLDPLDPNWHLCRAAVPFMAGDFATAASRMPEALRMAPDVPPFQFWAALILACTGSREAALECLAGLRGEPAQDAWVLLGRLLEACLLGDGPGFDGFLAGPALALLQRDYQNSYHVAAFQAGLGRHEAALDWLELAVDRSFGATGLILCDPFLAPVRDLPRFQRIVARARRSQASLLAQA